MTVDVYNDNGTFARYTSIGRVVRSSNGTLTLWQKITIDIWDTIIIGKSNYSWFEIGDKN